MSIFTGFSEKTFFKKYLKYWQSMSSDAFALNFWKELYCTDCSMRVLVRLIFKVTCCNRFKFLVFGNIKRVSRRFFFIQLIFFLKMKKGFNKNRCFMCQILKSECQAHPLTCVNLTQPVGRFNILVNLVVLSYWKNNFQR